MGRIVMLGSAPAAQIDVKAERFRLLGRVDRQLVADALAGSPGSARGVLLASSAASLVGHPNNLRGRRPAILPNRAPALGGAPG